jgi:hypothetical protein
MQRQEHDKHEEHNNTKSMASTKITINIKSIATQEHKKHHKHNNIKNIRTPKA